MGVPSRLSDDDLDLLLTIREFERALLRLFDEGAIGGTTHTCLGQEYVPVALSPLLEPGDRVFSNHRGHGHYLARFRDPAGLLAEITGRSGAVGRGVGGSQHIHRDGFLSTGVQGESLPVAAGAALHLTLAGERGLAAAYIGDGTWGEGAVYEALNMASLWNLPLLVVVEHNGIAQSTPAHRHTAGTIAARAAAFGVEHRRFTTADVNAVRAEMAPLVASVRERRRPLVAEFATVRLGPHSKGDDTRDEAELGAARARDWYAAYAAAHPAHLAAREPGVRRRIDALVHDNAARPPSTWEPAWS